VDPVGNSRRERPLRHPQSGQQRAPVTFDPACTNALGVLPAATNDQEDDDAND
jgi:hypothetical protein